MANLKKAKEVAFGSIAAAQTILERYPELLTTNSLISINASANPFDFLMDLLKSVGGYDNIIALLAKFLTLELDAIELAIKTILKTSMRNLITCSISPLVSDELIRNGVWFDLSQVDAMGYLSVNPLNKQIGQYFYFGCEEKDGISITDDLYKSDDLNAVIWYTKNKAVGDNKRVVWTNKLALSEEDRDNPDKIKPVITMEYVERASDLKDITGTGSVPNPIPLNNVLHIFLGDAKNVKTVKDNRYWKKTLIQFNINYINSIKLFDPKVVAAQIIDKLTGALSIDLSLSLSQQMVKYQISEIVRKVIEYDDTEISDCFFTFSNEQYDEMLMKSELEHAGLFSYNGEQNTNNPINPQEILNNLNGISSAASKEEQMTLIEGAMYEISATLSQEYEKNKYNLNFGVQMNFIEHIVYELSSVIVSSLITPKVYLLMAINISLMGLPGLPSISQFLQGYKSLIISIIKLIRDLLIKYLFDYLMGLLKPLIEMLAARMAIESVLFYKELIKQLLKACSFKRESGIFNQDIIGYADIIQTNSTPPDNEC